MSKNIGGINIKYISQKEINNQLKKLKYFAKKKYLQEVVINNQKYLEQELSNTDSILSNINGLSLDNEQRIAILMDEEQLLINAGAGSGKTLTMIGKIHYLITYKKVLPSEILCISFTNATTKSLQEKLLKYYNYDIEVRTFHKLALEIIASYQKSVSIANDKTLDYIIDEFLYHEQNRHQFLKRYLKNNDYYQFKQLIFTFINLYKSNAFTYHEFNTFFKKNISYTNHQILKIIFIIYNLYETELKSTNKVDFNDMINLATNLIQTNYQYKKFKYIIIDEYQDTSYTRFNLIKNIINHTNAKLLVVGDDFQSIYRFTGCDINLFLGFTTIFPNAKITSISNTYRNPQELIDIAGSFVMANKHQIKKNLKSNITYPKPIKIVYTHDKVKSLSKILLSHQDQEIFIIGRNNSDIEPYLSKEMQMNSEGFISYSKAPQTTIRYLTAHKAKGLESDIVILINLTNRVNGFPNQIVNPQLLKYVTISKEVYPFDEERRLFYVALTRTKSVNYLLVTKENESLFIKELLKKYRHQISITKE